MNKNFILLDTNVIVAFLDKKDSLHAKAVELIQNCDADLFGTLNILLGETYSVMVRRCKERKYDCSKAVETLRNFEQDLEIVKVDLENYHGRIVECLKLNFNLNYNDWLLFLYAVENGVEVLTLDKKLREALQDRKNNSLSC